LEVRDPAPPTLPVILAGLAAFLDLYSTQPLLPLLARTFHASTFAVSLTITAPTIGVAIAAPMVGRLADRVGLRTVIVNSAFALSGATFLAATAASLAQLIAWRFVQGLVTPGLFASTIAYIHEEWPQSRVGRVTAAYVSGTVVGGVVGRLVGGLVAADASWPASFVVLGALTLAVAAAIWMLLPKEHRQAHASETADESALAAHLRHPQLLATYAVGFCMLCTQVAMFTYVPFLLARPPFRLSSAALGSIFLSYLVGAVTTPYAGRGIDAYGHRAILVLALALCAGGALLTLAPSLAVIVAGLSLFAAGVFFAQAASSSHVAHHAGSVGGAVPSAFWNAGGWPACVAFIVAVELVMLAIAWTLWQPMQGTAEATLGPG
jgi:MFS transporter, YNFM family, putative membrane transport protein